MPRPLPPDPPIKYDDELQALLSKADRAQIKQIKSQSNEIPEWIDFVIDCLVSVV